MGKFFGKSRSQKKADNNLGVKASTLQYGSGMYRSERLHEIEKYVESKQYDHLADWSASESSGDYVKIRARKPKIIYPFAEVLSERVASKLLGRSTSPKLSIPEDDDTEELMKIVVDSTYLKSTLLKAMETFVQYNSVFVRFKISMGQLQYEIYKPQYCYPEFDAVGELKKLEVKYTYDDTEDLDGTGKPVKKWYKMELGRVNDVLFDNPVYTMGESPVFTPVNSVKHDLGFVQGEWFRNGIDKHSPDGDGKTMVEKCYNFIDSFNYNLSQSDSAVAYGQDPQLVVTGMEEDEIENLIKSSSKGWNLGREGTASFMEVSGSGAETGKVSREDTKQDIQDIARVVMLDPEKIVGSAQSAKAMEVLHGPLVELINQMRPHVERGMIKLIQKSLTTLMIMNQRGMPLAINMPPQYTPTSLDIKVAWPPIFPLTTQDKQQIVALFMQLSSGNVLSRETVLKNILALIPDIEVDDLEMELNRVNTQQQFNTFGF